MGRGRVRRVALGVVAAVVATTAGCVEPPPVAPPDGSVQILTVDPSQEALKRIVAFELGDGDAGSGTIDLLGFPFVFNLGDQQNWMAHAHEYIFTISELPSADEVRIALEAIPSIGAGGVEVDALPWDGSGMRYRLTFPQPRPLLRVTGCWTVFPQETLAAALAQIDDPAPIPGGYADLDAWIDDVQEQLSEASLADDWASYMALLPQLQALQLRRDVERDPASAEAYRTAVRNLYVSCPTVVAAPTS